MLRTQPPPPQPQRGTGGVSHACKHTPATATGEGAVTATTAAATDSCSGYTDTAETKILKLLTTWSSDLSRMSSEHQEVVDKLLTQLRQTPVYQAISAACSELTYVCSLVCCLLFRQSRCLCRRCAVVNIMPFTLFLFVFCLIFVFFRFLLLMCG